MIFGEKNYGLTKKAEDLHKEMDKLMNYYAKKMEEMDQKLDRILKMLER